jgi:hypothetical protein
LTTPIVDRNPLRVHHAPVLSGEGPTITWRYVIILAVLVIALGAPLVGIIIWLARPFDAMATPSQLAAIQARRPDTVMLPVDLRYNAAFKLARLAEVQPEIASFGSSRAGGFRAEMFAPRRFYNMSYTAWTTDQLLDIFDRTTRENHPRVAILELDYFLFADHWEQWFATKRTMIHGRSFRYVMESLGSFLRAAAASRAPFAAYDRTQAAFIGPQSIVSQEGFRNDGSYVYSAAYVTDAQQRYRNAEFFAGTVPPDYAMSRRVQAPIARLAALARQRGVKLVAVQLPMLRAGIDLLENDASYHPRAGAWRDFESEQTKSWLAGLGIPLVDLARSPIDNDPDNFVDAIHLSERGMDRAMRALWADPAFRDAIELGASENKPDSGG